MSSQDLDQLFKKKLENAEYTPSANAWRRVAENVNGTKSNRKFYLSIAAGVIVIFTIGILTGIQLTEDETDPQLVENTIYGFPEDKDSVNNRVPETIENSVAEMNSESSIKLEDQDKEALPKVTKSKSIINKKPITTDATLAIVSKPEEENQQKVDESKLPVLPKEEIDNKTIAKVTPEETPVIEQPEIKISTETSIADATVPAETASEERGLSLKKVLEMARDFKTDNDAWGSLREAKNELLAVGRKKETRQE